MNAQALPNIVPILAAYTLGADKVLETGCQDFDAWKQLPAAVMFEGQVFSKTGWNSDTGRACYKTNVRFAIGVTQ